MTFRVIVYILTNKTPIILICMIGVVAFSYGMLKDNTLIFIIGLSFVFGGYLLIRKKNQGIHSKQSIILILSPHACHISKIPHGLIVLRPFQNLTIFVTLIKKI